MDDKNKTPPEDINAHTLGDAYFAAMKELALPYPSFKLSHWKSFNEVLGGFRTREFSIFCAPTGVGKTQFLANVSSQLVRDDIKHFVMSVETGYTDYVKRMMSAVSGKDLNLGDAVDVAELEKFDKEWGHLFKNNLAYLSLHDNRVPVEKLVGYLKRMVDMGYRIAILDNLNFFMEPASAMNYNIEMDRVTHELVMLVKQIDLHLILVMHPNKNNKSGRVENEFDIKGSSTAVQEAHNIFAINRPSEEELEQGGKKLTDRELKFIKLRRRGQYVGFGLWFEFRNGTYIESTQVRSRNAGNVSPILGGPKNGPGMGW